MKNSFLADLGIAVMVVIAILLIYSTQLYSLNDRTPADLKSGDPVALLTGKSIIEGDHVCQEYRAGFVNTFGPNGEEYWFKPERLLFPTAQVISIIHKNGNYEWVRYTKVVKTPATAEDMLCLSPIAE